MSPSSKTDIDHGTNNMSGSITKSESACVGTDPPLNSANHTHTYNLHPQKAMAPSKKLMQKYTSQILDAGLLYYQETLSFFVNLKTN